jgi:hypothetical protein
MLSIRPATINDVTLLRTLICELADYEHELDMVVITEADLVRDGFGPQPKFRVLLAYWDRELAGYAQHLARAADVSGGSVCPQSVSRAKGR